MKRFLMLLCIFGPSVAIALSFWAVHATRAAATPGAENPSGRVVIPAGTRVRVRLVGELSNAMKPGDTIQAIVADPVLEGSQTLIPPETRGFVRVLAIEKRPEKEGDVTLQLLSLNSQNERIPIHSNPITIAMKRVSDLNVMSRAAEGLIGGAIGAAGGAAVGSDPRLAAGAAGEWAAGKTPEDNDSDAVVFQIDDPIDVTGIKW